MKIKQYLLMGILAISCPTAFATPPQDVKKAQQQKTSYKVNVLSGYKLRHVPNRLLYTNLPAVSKLSQKAKKEKRKKRCLPQPPPPKKPQRN